MYGPSVNDLVPDMPWKLVLLVSSREWSGRVSEPGVGPMGSSLKSLA